MPDGGKAKVILNRVRGRKRATLRVDPVRRAAVLMAPPRMALRDLSDFLQANAGWVERKLRDLPAPSLLKPGETLSILGRPTRLSLAEGRRGFRLEPSTDGQSHDLLIIGAATRERFAQAAQKALMSIALERARAVAGRLAAILGKAPTSIAVRAPRSRWGSCTRAGAIMLNWRLVLGPAEVLDHVVAHEMAHLEEMNHSPRFWAHVARLDPDWKASRAWLRHNGQTLMAGIVTGPMAM